MASRNKATRADDDALNAAQVEFTMNPAFAAPHAVHFWEAHARILDEIEDFSAAWYRRRKDASRSLIDVARRLGSDGHFDPASAASELARWQTGSLERIAEDARDCTELVGRCAGAIFSGEVATMEDAAHTVEAATRTSKSDPV